MEKQKGEESGRGSQEVRRSEMEKVRRKKMQVRAKVGKLIWGSGGSKSNLAKAAGAEPAGQMRDEKVHAIVARTHFQVKSVKNPQSQTTFGS